jgi:hypothetical protein
MLAQGSLTIYYSGLFLRLIIGAISDLVNSFFCRCSALCTVDRVFMRFVSRSHRAKGIGQLHESHKHAIESRGRSMLAGLR